MQYLDLLEHCKNSGQHKILNVVSEAMPFVFDLSGVKDAADIETIKQADLPFKTCSFEVLGGAMGLTNSSGEKMIDINCIVAHELSPGKVIYFTLDYMTDGYAHVKWFHPDDSGSSVWKFLNKMVTDLLETLSTGQHGHSSPRTVFKWKDGAGEKKQRRITKVIHVRSRGTTSETSGTRNVTWSHAFWVMGHWRNIDGIGKNRDGEYCVSGKTWVTAFVKRAELGDPVQKIRLFKGQEDSV